MILFLGGLSGFTTLSPQFMSRLAHPWLLTGQPTVLQVSEKVVVDKLPRSLPRGHRQAVGMQNPESLSELVQTLELTEAAQAWDIREKAGVGSKRWGYMMSPCPPPTNPNPGFIVHHAISSGVPERRVRIVLSVQ